ncbi:glycosyltransferase family 9 protein [Pseudomonas sp. SH1-B]
MSVEETVIKPGMSVAVVSCPALGDTSLFLRLAWRLQAAGARVTLVSPSLASLSGYLPGLQVVADVNPNLLQLANSNALVICYIDWLIKAVRAGGDLTQVANIAYLSGKKLPENLRLSERPVMLEGIEVPGAHNVICRDPKAGKTMVQWIDLYAEEILGLDLAVPVTGFQGLPALANDAERRVAIFPTTPHVSKNFSSSGFRRLARRLSAKGWHVEFVGIVSEQQALSSQYPGHVVHAFTDLKGLVDYLRTCSVVVSNDSGGGHLGSLLGLRTFTITRRRSDFTWRPGFNDLNQVINPVISFKWMGYTVWRPFIPLRRIVTALADVRSC